MDSSIVILAGFVVVVLLVWLVVVRRRGAPTPEPGHREQAGPTNPPPQSGGAPQPPPHARPAEPPPSPYAYTVPTYNIGNNKIFISYRRQDSGDIAGRIYDVLVAAFGSGAIFKDVDSIPKGSDYHNYLEDTVSSCRALIAVIGDEWLDTIYEDGDKQGQRRLDDPNDWVRLEIEHALSLGIAVIPVLVRGTRMPPEDKLPFAIRRLARRNATMVRSDPDFRNDMERLIRAIQSALEAPIRP